MWLIYPKRSVGELMASLGRKMEKRRLGCAQRTQAGNRSLVGPSRVQRGWARPVREREEKGRMENFYVFKLRGIDVQKNILITGHKETGKKDKLRDLCIKQFSVNMSMSFSQTKGHGHLS